MAKRDSTSEELVVAEKTVRTRGGGPQPAGGHQSARTTTLRR